MVDCYPRIGKRNVVCGLWTIGLSIATFSSSSYELGFFFAVDAEQNIKDLRTYSCEENKFLIFFTLNCNIAFWVRVYSHNKG